MTTPVAEVRAGMAEVGAVPAQVRRDLAALDAQERRLLDEYEVAIWKHPERVQGIGRALARVQREIERWGA